LVNSENSVSKSEILYATLKLHKLRNSAGRWWLTVTSVRQLIRCGTDSFSAVAWRYMRRHLWSP